MSPISGLHWANATFKKYTFDDRVKVNAPKSLYRTLKRLFQKLMKAVGFSTPQVVQSMYIFKVNDSVVQKA